MVDATLIATLVTLVLTIVSSVAGLKYQQAKTKANKLADLINEIVAANGDDRVTEDEFNRIVDKVRALVQT